MTDAREQVVVIGGGQAGLGISYHLQQQGLRHKVLERGRVGETWHTQRWDSFVLNTPTKVNVLPGDVYAGPHPDGFVSAGEFASYLRGYADRHRLPVFEHTRVTAVEPHSSGFTVRATRHGVEQSIICGQVVVASGAMNQKHIPPVAGELSRDIQQCHAAEYRNPSQLKKGAVLVVGGGQSGLQVAEDLVDAGRQVYLSTSAVGRVPRRYRGTEIVDWLLMIGFYDVRTEDIADPRELQLRNPQVSGVGPRGHTQSLQSLARKGVVILGQLERIHGGTACFFPNAAAHVRFADDVSERIKRRIDEFITRNRMDVPPNETDLADEPDPDAGCVSSRTSLDLSAEDIRSIVWTTGFTADFSYVRLPVLDGNGKPKHRRGVSDVPGLYFLGLPWLCKRKSGIICGVRDDAEEMARVLMNQAH